MQYRCVLQINGRPFVVREADKPFQNLEYTGIDRSRVEDMEARLKADVLREVGIRIINNRVSPESGPDSNLKAIWTWRRASRRTSRMRWAQIGGFAYVLA